MVAEADKLTGGERYTRDGEEYIYSTFLTNKDFSTEACDKTKCAKNTIERHIRAYAEIGWLKEVYSADRDCEGTLYADGYFVRLDDGNLRKISFLQETPEIKEGLRMLPKLVTKYRKKNKTTKTNKIKEVIKRR
jgi:hypothetical protein